MFGSWVLDVAIGLVVVFILFATICATVREGLDAWFKTRAAFLERGIRELLNDREGQGLSKDLYEHPLIFGLFSGEYKRGQQKRHPGAFDRGDNLPSYIPSKSFALALMDLVARGPLVNTHQNGASPTLTSDAPLTLAGLRASAAGMDNNRVARAMVSAIDAAQGDLEQARRNIEQWFDSAMDRVSGWYRRKTNLVVFFIGIILAATFNIDTFAIANHLYRNQTAREQIVAHAERMLKERAEQTSLTRTELVTQQAPMMLTLEAPGSAGGTGALTSRKLSESPLFNDALSLPIGWTTLGDYSSPRVLSLMIAGWLMTALAATLGAPFWFDMLNKIMIVRSTVKSYEKSPEKRSKERTFALPAGATSSWPQQAVTWTAAPGTFERRHATQIPFDEAGDVDGCGECGQAEVDDKDLPQAHGGVR
jgi:hypothetical protein